MPERLFNAVSLGITCSTKFQILRHNYCAEHPGATIEDVRNSLSMHRRDTHIFDWQITPFASVAAYIERDFVGIFERDDLEIYEPDGVARNRRFDVIHTHAFHPQGTLTEADIDAQYPMARSKIDYLAGKFRGLLDRERGPILYIAGNIPPAGEVARFISVLKHRAPRQRYHLAFIGKSGVSLEHDLSEFGDRISQFVVNAASGKSAEYQWEGDDETWEMALRTLAANARICPQPNRLLRHRMRLRTRWTRFYPGWFRRTLPWLRPRTRWMQLRQRFTASDTKSPA
jgi:hypothetical protein